MFSFQVDSLCRAVPESFKKGRSRLESIRSRMCRLNHDDESHFFSSSKELLSSFQCQQPTKTKAAQEIRTGGLQISQLMEIRRNHFFQGLILYEATVQASRLNRVDWLMGFHVVSQWIIFKDISSVAVHEEERWLRSAWSDWNQRRPGGFPVILSKHFSQIANGGRLQQGGQRQSFSADFVNFR